MTELETEEFIKGRIKHYRKYAPRKEGDREIPGLWTDEGNIWMARKIIWQYEQELKKIQQKRDE